VVSAPAVGVGDVGVGERDRRAVLAEQERVVTEQELGRHRLRDTGDCSRVLVRAGSNLRLSCLDERGLATCRPSTTRSSTICLNWAPWVTTSVHPKNVVLTVENTGEKLTTQLAATLVEPFLRCTKRIRTEHAGVGLGLAVVKSITNAHDGTLTLTARAAGGLRVTVQLPAAPPHTGS
jgi:signal transduction histidine kinase